MTRENFTSLLCRGPWLCENDDPWHTARERPSFTALILNRRTVITMVWVVGWFTETGEGAKFTQLFIY